MFDGGEVLLSSSRKKGYRGLYVGEDGLEKPAVVLVFESDDSRFYGGEVAALSRNALLGVGPQVFELVQSIEIDGAVRPVIIEEDVGVSLESALFDQAVVPGLPGEGWDAPLSDVGSDLRKKESKKILFDVLVQVSNLHANGLYHRDIRAANVCIRRFGPGPEDIHAALIDHELSTSYQGSEVPAAARSYEEFLFVDVPSMINGNHLAIEPSSLERDLGYVCGLCFELETGKSLMRAGVSWFKNHQVTYFRYKADGVPEVSKLEFGRDIRPLAEDLGLRSIETEHLFSDDQLEAIREQIKHGGYVDARDMRMVAPLSGVGFGELDDRRELRRKKIKRRLVLSGALALLLACAIFAVQQVRLAISDNQSEENKSAYLAQESLDLLERGDRMQAIQVAAAALLDDGLFGNGINGGQAQYALEQALEVYPSGRNTWRACYSMKDQSDADTLAADADADCIVTRDSDTQVSIYRLSTGELLKSLSIEEAYGDADSGVDAFAKEPAILMGGVALLRLKTNAAVLVYLGNGQSDIWTMPQPMPLTGHLESAYFSSKSSNESGVSRVCTVCSAGKGELVFDSFDYGSNDGIRKKLKGTASDGCLKIDPRGTTAFVCTGSFLYRIDLLTGKVSKVAAGKGSFTSLVVGKEQVMLAESLGDGKGAVVSYDATDLELEARTEVSWGHASSSSDGAIRIRGGSLSKSKNQIESAVVTAGRSLYVFDGDAATVKGKHEFESRVAGCKFWGGSNGFMDVVLDSGECWYAIPDGSGKLACARTGSVSSSSGLSRAVFGFSGEMKYLAVSRSDESGRMVVYRQEVSPESIEGIEACDTPSSAPLYANCDRSLAASGPNDATSSGSFLYFAKANGDLDSSVAKRALKLLSSPKTLCVYQGSDFSIDRTIDLSAFGISFSAPENAGFAFVKDSPSRLLLWDTGDKAHPTQIWLFDLTSDQVLSSWASPYWEKGLDCSDVRIRQTEGGSAYVYLGASKKVGLVCLDLDSLNVVGEFATRGSNAVASMARSESGLLWTAGDGSRYFSSTISGVGNREESRKLKLGDSKTDLDLPSVSPDGRLFVVWGNDSALYGVDALSGEEKWHASLDIKQGFYDSFSPDGKHLIVQDSKNVCHMLNVETGREESTVSVPEGCAIANMSYSKDGSKVYARADLRFGNNEFASSLGESSLLVFSLSDESLSLQSCIGFGFLASESGDKVLLRLKTGCFVSPVWSVGELKSKASETVSGHELTDNEKKLYGIG
ncbi:MAG: protein kinase family protein [Coriobacteriia bacterium]|nr:protein kinase family protein [Coriobacteriia bacterium]